MTKNSKQEAQEPKLVTIHPSDAQRRRIESLFTRQELLKRDLMALQERYSVAQHEINQELRKLIIDYQDGDTEQVRLAFQNYQLHDIKIPATWTKKRKPRTTKQKAES